MDAPRAPRRTAPALLDDAIDAVSDIEQARADAEHHRSLELFHARKAHRLEAIIDGKVVVAAEALARLRARRRLLTTPPDDPGTSPQAQAAAEAAATFGPTIAAAA